ncbi:uncharacterized protein SPAPADRAFT_63057 [Spathaspora passalidarum NRRL Y-27907]|uniref:Pan3 C-terminal knob domain-containing protein n=1 Tax=Spathaspora passalidarum (strain NRRL Y-27907 / 11-Y1) TaxID=619300 RepID=G3ASS9_SPAPN|nr:uncharacterized protein SPAPADRAFT_63057 [Spathaspora passalidarum NRRL Y-27907]EGW31143.1 hypothetical protein SPAPADRAFT_63057 [Spathaspora passalidarum NRRL Y-27907]
MKEIPVFVPDGSGYKFNASTPSFTPAPASQGSTAPPATSAAPPPPPPPLAVSTPQAVPPPQSSTPNPYLNDYFHTPAAATYPLQYHLYAPQPPPRLTLPLAPHESNPHLLFIPNDLRETLHRKNEATLQTMVHSTLPPSINQYHSLVPIDRTYQESKSAHSTVLYKVFSSLDGNPYVMRKIENVEPEQIDFSKFKKWKSVDCANVVRCYDAFSSLSFGKSCLIAVFDYYPNSNTLAEHHKKLGSAPINDEILWGYLLQLVNAVKCLHEKGLSGKGTINLNKIIVTNKDRIRLSSGSISDLLGDEDQDPLDDIHNIGKVLLELSTLTLPINMRSGNIYQTLKSRISEELIESIRELVDADQTFELTAFQSKLSSQTFNVINKLQHANDFMEAQLTSELENARLFRLMTKINYVMSSTNSPELKIIKLFHDHVFNCYDERGKRVVDLSKVLVNLNKLDCGIDEKVLLVSNDDNECIIASFKEIRDIIDSQFRVISRE